MQIEIGLKGEASCVVTHDMTAAHVGSGDAAVFATPMMVALMEKAALTSLQPTLEPGQSSVGTKISVSHSSATPVGMTVRAESEVVEVDRRRVVFSVRAFDEAGLIGEGTHERFVIDVEKFLAKSQSKKADK